MSTRLSDRSSPLFTGLLLLIATFPMAPAACAAPSPFQLVKGSWAGGGALNFKDGRSEKLTCTAYYTSSADGAALTTALRCSGPTAKLELRSHLQNANGKVSGSWEERTYNGSGAASGTLRPGNLQLSFRGGVAGSMTVTFSAASQTVSIAISSTEVPVKGMRFTMRRR